MKFSDLGDKGAQFNITVEAAPAGVKLAAGAAMGALSGVGGHILGAVFGPIGSIGMAAAMAHQGATLGMKMADKIWDFFSDKLGGDDNAEEFAMAHLTAAVKGLPTFDYRGKTYNVKVPQQQARTAAVEVRKVTESLTERRQGGLNEFAPAGRDPWGDDEEPGSDPYSQPEPKHYSRSIDFFGKFEADHFDREDMNDATGEFKGYWDYDGKLKQIAYFKFDKPNQAGSDDPGMGWYYEPNEDSDAGTSATPAVDTSAQRKQQELGMIDAFLKSGQKAKPGSQIYALMKKHGMAEGIEARLNTKYTLKNMFGDVKSLDNLSREQLNKAMDGRVNIVGRKFRGQEGNSFRYDVKLDNGNSYIMHIIYVHGLIDAWLTDEENNKIPLSKVKPQGVAEGNINERASQLLSAQDRNGVITVVVQAPDGTKRSLADENPRYINQWLMKYDLSLPRSITSKFVENDLNEFAPAGSGDGGDDGFSEETLKKLAAQWWNGDEDPTVEKTLLAAGWEIGQDEGYDNGGVFVVMAGDEHGKSYISWPAEELQLDEASLAQMRDYFSKDDADSVRVDRNYDAPSKKQNPAGIPHEIQALVNKMYHAGKITPQEFEILRKFQQRTKINVGIREADANPYAIGMSQAMKSTGDTPPLKKSTINKAHKIARAIKKDE